MKLLKSLFGPKDPQQLYDEAMKQIERNEYAKASRLLEKAIRILPNSGPSHFTLGFCYSRMGEEKGISESTVESCLENAAKQFQSAVELADQGGLDSDQIGKACFGIGTYYQYKKSYQDSIKYLERTISLCPEMLDAHILLSISYQQAGEQQKALRIAEECLSKKPNSELVQQHWKALCKEQGVEPYSRLTEGEKRKIYKDLREEIDDIFLMGTNLMSDLVAASSNPFGGLAKMGQSIEKAGDESRNRAIGRISSRYKLSEFEATLILSEGDQKNWPFKGVV